MKFKFISTILLSALQVSIIACDKHESYYIPVYGLYHEDARVTIDIKDKCPISADTLESILAQSSLSKPALLYTVIAGRPKNLGIAYNATDLMSWWESQGLRDKPFVELFKDPLTRQEVVGLYPFFWHKQSKTLWCPLAEIFDWTDFMRQTIRSGIMTRAVVLRDELASDVEQELRKQLRTFQSVQGCLPYVQRVMNISSEECFKKSYYEEALVALEKKEDPDEQFLETLSGLTDEIERYDATAQEYRSGVRILYKTSSSELLKTYEKSCIEAEQRALLFLAANKDTEQLKMQALTEIANYSGADKYLYTRYLQTLVAQELGLQGLHQDALELLRFTTDELQAAAIFYAHPCTQVAYLFGLRQLLYAQSLAKKKEYESALEICHELEYAFKGHLKEQAKLLRKSLKSYCTIM